MIFLSFFPQIEKFGLNNTAITDRESPAPEGDIQQSSYTLTIFFLHCLSFSPYV